MKQKKQQQLEKKNDKKSKQQLEKNPINCGAKT